MALRGCSHHAPRTLPMHTRFESEDPLALGAGKQGPSATGDATTDATGDATADATGSPDQ